MIGLAIVLAGFVLVAAGLTARHYADRVIEEIHRAELREVDRERRQREFDANVSARWVG